MKCLWVVIALAGLVLGGLAGCDETSCSDDCDSQCAALECTCSTETNGDCECEGCGELSATRPEGPVADFA